MIKQTLKYKDFDGKEVIGDFWFHLSLTEIAELEKDLPGGLEEYLTDILEKDDHVTFILFFRDFLCKAYGKRTEDAKRFIKTPETPNEFAQHVAFDELIQHLLSDTNRAIEFFKGTMPESVQQKVGEIEGGKAIEKIQIPQLPVSSTVSPLDELANMSDEDLENLLTKRKKNKKK